MLCYHNYIILLFIDYTNRQNSAQNGKLYNADIDQFGYLHTIAENHVDMVKLYENMREIVAANQMGPKLYLYPIYTYYSSLFSDKIKLMTERIFEQDTIPSLPVKIRENMSIATKLH